MMRPMTERFDEKVLVLPSGCWRWIGHCSQTTGYGQIGRGRKVFYAHRYSYERFIGRIPRNHHIDHLCRNRWCVQPWHLEAVTQQENNVRSNALRWAKRTHCMSGLHKWTMASTKEVRIGSKVVRLCIECNLATKLRWYRKHVAAERQVVAQ